MMPHSFLSSEARAGLTESGTALDAVIRPCILQAFPLPAPDHADEEKFRLLLEALARRRSEKG